METKRVRNEDLDQWEVAVNPASEAYRTPVFLVEPKETLGAVDMVPRTLNGWFHCPGEYHSNGVIRYNRSSEN